MYYSPHRKRVEERFTNFFSFFTVNPVLSPHESTMSEAIESWSSQSRFMYLKGGQIRKLC